MKKLFLSILIVLSILLIFPVSAFAATSYHPKLTVNSVSVNPGEPFDIKVNIKNNPGIVSANLKLDFDEELTLVGAENGDAFSTLTYIPPKKLASGGEITKSCQFVWMGFDIADKDIKNGVILTLTFKLSETAKPGNMYNIAVYSEKGNVIDKELNEITLSAKGTVEAIASGDDVSPSQSIFQRIINILNLFIEKLLSIFSMDT